MRTSPSNDPYRDSGVLHTVCALGSRRLDELLDLLDVDLTRSGHTYEGCCPIHEGDNPAAFSLWANGYEVRGNWSCRTDRCGEFFRRTLIGFVRGVLSRRRSRWGPEHGVERRVSHRAAVDYICEFLGTDAGDIEVDHKLIARKRASRGIESVFRSGPDYRPMCEWRDLRRMLEVPSPYFLGRGYSPETLEYFGVGTCTERRSRAYGRVVIPVYDPSGTILVGAISRSGHEKCGECHLCHGPTPCPGGNRLPYARYRNEGDGFVDKRHLYNLWNAAPHIAILKSVVIVEGAADVWRLHEAGARNAVALFGSDLSNDQNDALINICMKVNRVFVLTDDDDAGHKAFDAIDRAVYGTKTRVLPVGSRDVGGMSTESVREIILPQLRT